MPDKELKIKITGDSTAFGAESRRTIQDINNVKNAAMGMAAAFSGGFLGGGISGAIQAAVKLIGDKIEETRELIKDAKRLEISPGRLRSARTLEEAAGIRAGNVESAIANARQSRSDARAGDPKALKNLSALGLKIEDLFRAIAEAFKQKGTSTGVRQALAGVIGAGAEQELSGYLASGQAFDAPLLRTIVGQELFRLMSGNGLGARLGRAALGMGLRSAPDPMAGDRINLEPLSMYSAKDHGTATEDRLHVENYRKALEMGRERLNTEQRLNAIAKEKAEVEELIKHIGDKELVEREKGYLLSLEGEASRISNREGRRAAHLGTFIPTADELAQRGLFVGGAGGASVPQILNVHTQKMDHMIRVLEAQFRANEKNWGD